VVSELRPITLEKYRELQNADTLLPRAFTIDIETIPLPGFKERAAQRLKRAMQRGKMSDEQQERYSRTRPLKGTRKQAAVATSGRAR
jgi:hypothetical protein